MSACIFSGYRAHELVWELVDGKYLPSELFNFGDGVPPPKLEYFKQEVAGKERADSDAIRHAPGGEAEPQGHARRVADSPR